MRRGFTLVEMVVALTLFTLLMNSLFYALSTGLRSWKKMSGQASARQVRLVVAERICADLREAALLPGSSSGEVVFRLDGDQISYQLSAGKVKRNSAYLTSEDEVKRLAFSYPAGRLVTVRLDDLSFEVYARNR
jgi:prepilin-type N-terminal cleavage/methylation domain-containing protein